MDIIKIKGKNVVIEIEHSNGSTKEGALYELMPDGWFSIELFNKNSETVPLDYGLIVTTNKDFIEIENTNDNIEYIDQDEDYIFNTNYPLVRYQLKD